VYRFFGEPDENNENDIAPLLLYNHFIEYEIGNMEVSTLIVSEIGELTYISVHDATRSKLLIHIHNKPIDIDDLEKDLKNSPVHSIDTVLEDLEILIFMYMFSSEY
jgi:hypothetical protein